MSHVRSIVIFSAVIVGTFAFFLTIGFVVRLTPIAVEAFAPSPVSLFQLAVLSCILGLFAGVVLSYDGGVTGRVVETLVCTIVAGIAFAIGLGNVAPYVLPGSVVVMYGASYILIAVSIEFVRRYERDRLWKPEHA